MDASRTAGLVVAAVILCQPAPIPAPRHGPPPGRSGWLSDRGEEVHLRFEGLLAADGGGDGQPASPPDDATLRAAVLAQVREAARAARRELPPIPLDASDVDVSFPEPGRTWSADVAFVVLDDAPGDGVARPGAYRDLDLRLVLDSPEGPLGAPVRIASAAGPDPDRAPECAGLVSRGELRVVALFGQMETEKPLAVDQGAVSLRRFRTLLESRGFASAPGPGPNGGALLEGVPARGSARIRIELVPPGLLLQGDTEATAAALDRATRAGDVVYYLGHSGVEALAAWSEAETWRGARTRLLVLDSCWSFQRSVRGILAAAGPGLDVLSNPFRTYVGSVDSLDALIVALESCTDRRPDAAPVASWRAILGRMNDLAGARLAARLAENPSTSRRDREVYGISGLPRSP